jgi:hypothetical protein
MAAGNMPKTAKRDNGIPAFAPILPKAPENPCPIEHILYGPPIDPEQRIKGYSEDEFENFIREWAFYRGQLADKRYVQVGRFGGAGDMGRDVVGYLDPVATNGRLDIFQCKHYGHGLQPGEVWGEIGKLLYYTFIKAFAVPDLYRFVCPHDVGPELGRLFENPETLRANIIAVWAEKIEKNITKKRPIQLEGVFLDYVKVFDFSVISYKPIHEIIVEHKTTIRYAPRFGGGLIIKRSPDLRPPTVIADHEQRYVEKLIRAYQDHSGNAVTLTMLDGSQQKHLDRSRERYFCAETLRLDVRDNLPEGVTFEQVQDQVFDAVIDIAEDKSHPNGLARVDAVTNHAGNYVVQDHALKSYVNVKVLKGVCHQLANANEDRLTWVPE